jgi:hypothetical protein
MHNPKKRSHTCSEVEDYDAMVLPDLEEDLPTIQEGTEPSSTGSIIDSENATIPNRSHKSEDKACETQNPKRI